MPSVGRDFESSVKGELAVLYRVARRMGATAEEAEDLVQVTLLKAFGAWSSFDGRYLRSWLIRILRNERLMAVRADRNESSLEDGSEGLIAEGPFWDDLNLRLDAEAVIRELDELPDIYKMAIQLIDVEQLSYEEAALAMEVPIGTVRSRLFRGREMLRRRLQDELGTLQEVHS